MPIEYNENDNETEGQPKKRPAETALIPKSLLMNKEVGPGDRVILEVTHVYEDEVELAYPTKEKEPMDEANEALDGMTESEEPETA